MSYFEKKCSNCGATYVEGDTYCRTCHTAIEQEPIIEEERLEGIKISDWHMFIDKNATRYVDIFSKNKGKRIFLNMNWAAFFFNFYWMFYRKMYKYAFIFLAVSMIFSLTVTALVVTAFKPAFAEAQRIIEPYSQYLTETDGLFSAYSDGSVDVSVIFDASSEYDKAINAVIAKMAFWIIIPSLIFGLLFGLLADCIYRAYILRNIQYKSGGTSGWSLVAGIVIYQAISNIIESPLFSLIVAKLLE